MRKKNGGESGRMHERTKREIEREAEWVQKERWSVR